MKIAVVLIVASFMSIAMDVDVAAFLNPPPAAPVSFAISTKLVMKVKDSEPVKELSVNEVGSFFTGLISQMTNGAESKINVSYGQYLNEHEQVVLKRTSFHVVILLYEKDIYHLALEGIAARNCSYIVIQGRRCWFRVEY